MRIWLPIAAVLLALLGACATPSPAPAPGAAVSLVSEQQRLAALFRGTSVAFSMQGNGSLYVTVPLHFSFDSRRAVVKPPLAAVLDRLASSQRSAATRFRVSAPADPSHHNTRLAQERAESTRDYLVAHGIAPMRFIAATAAPGDLVLVAVMESGAP